MSLTKDEVKLEKHRIDMKLINDLATNPMVVAVGLYIVLENIGTRGGWWSEFKGSAVEAAVFATPVIVAAFKSGFLTEAMKSMGEAGKSVAGALPLLAMAAA